MERESDRTRAAEINAYLDHIDRLLLDDPKAARIAVAPLPLLVAPLDLDTRVRAYSSLALAQLKNGEADDARSTLHLATSMESHCRPTTRALVKLRESSLHLAAERFGSADASLREALGLASKEPSGSLLGRIHMKRGIVAVRQSLFRIAAEHYGVSLDALPDDHHLRSVAAWNLMLAVYQLDGRDARSLLKHLHYLGLRCRRPRAKSHRKTVPACLICWVEGQLYGVLGYQPHAVRCMSWAANALLELGALREATLCALDLVAVDRDGLPKVTAVLETFTTDAKVPLAVKEAAREWISAPKTDRAEEIRSYLLHGRKLAVETD